MDILLNDSKLTLETLRTVQVVLLGMDNRISASKPTNEARYRHNRTVARALVFTHSGTLCKYSSAILLIQINNEGKQFLGI